MSRGRGVVGFGRLGVEGRQVMSPLERIGAYPLDGIMSVEVFKRTKKLHAWGMGGMFTVSFWGLN